MSVILDHRGRPFARRPQPDTSKIGFTGIRRYKGMVNEEYFAKLQGVKRIDVIDRMRSDGMVQAVITALRLPIMAAAWNVEPAGRDANAQKAADLVEHNLFELLGECWEAEVREQLNALVYGFHVSAINWEVRDGAVVLDDLTPIHPRTILQSSKRWELDPQGRVLACWQYGSDGETFREERLPGDRILHLTTDAEYRNPEGRTILRGAYKHWHLKEHHYNADAIGSERSAVGTPWGTYPKDTSEEKQQAFYDSLAGIITDEAGALVTEEGYNVQNFSIQTKTYETFKSIQHHDAKIAQSVLAGFLTLGQEGNGGAYALSSDLTDLFLLALEFYADYLCARFNRVIIPKLVGYNLATDQYPKLSATVARQSAIALASILRQLTAGINPLVTPDEDLEDYIRELLQLPPRTAPRPATTKPEPAGKDPKAEPATKDDGAKDETLSRKRERIELRVLSAPAAFKEEPAYEALGTVAADFHGAIVALGDELKARVIRIANLPVQLSEGVTYHRPATRRLSGGRAPQRFAEDEAEKFTLSDAQKGAIDEAVSKFITSLMGEDQSAAGFANTDAEDGTLQHYERLAHSIGAEEARRLTDAEAAAFQPTRESPEIKALLENAFGRLSNNGQLRIGSQLAGIQETLTEGMLAGRSPLDVASDLDNLFTGYAEFEWERLARTEMAYAACQGQIDEYAAEGIEELENLVSALACPVCQAFAGTRVKVSEAVPGENCAPFHPNCLDSTVPVVPAA